MSSSPVASEKHDLRAGLTPAKIQLLEQVIKILKTKKKEYGGCLVMTGAGISTSAGIPDFRSPNSGLYSQLAKYNLSQPEDIFTLDFFIKDPRPYFQLAKELDPNRYLPTPTHWFIRKIHDEGILRRNYTQNVDSIEFRAGLPHKSVIQAHGGFSSGHCINGHKADMDRLQRHVENASPYYCPACKAPVKHDITMFGEEMPSRFRQNYIHDFQKCDMLLVIGTSLKVAPFNGLIRKIGFVPRVLINREKAGTGTGQINEFNFDDDSSNDLFLEGECDKVIQALAEEIEWSLNPQLSSSTPDKFIR